MTFRDRMTAEVGDSDPRWLYLLRKNTDGAGLAWLLVTLGFEFSDWWMVEAALLAVLAYVLVGQVLWWSKRPLLMWGRGGLVADVVYHAWTGALPLVLAYTVLMDGRLGGVIGWVVWLLVWWQLDTAGFGPVRPGS